MPVRAGGPAGGAYIADDLPLGQMPWPHHRSKTERKEAGKTKAQENTKSLCFVGKSVGILNPGATKVVKQILLDVLCERHSMNHMAGADRDGDVRLWL